MSTLQNALTIRTRKIGILLIDARRLKQQTEEACASAMNVSPKEYHEFETGKRMPSLPQLEALAYFLDVPLEHFWRNEAKSEQKDTQLDTVNLIPLRQKIIGIKLRQLRTSAKINTEDFARQMEIDADTLNRYELGEIPIPLPVLEQMLALLNENISVVADHQGKIGKWYRQHEAESSVQGYSAEIQAFLAQPVNKPYLELARKLSRYDAEKLRAIAESLLEITY